MNDVGRTSEEYRDGLRNRLTEIELVLSRNYSKSAYTQAQMEVRASGASKQSSLREWLARRTRMDGERFSLVREKKEIELELSSLRSQKTEDCLEKSGLQREDRDRLLQEITNGNTEITSLLRSILAELVRARVRREKKKEKSGG